MNEVPKMPRNHNSRYLIVKEKDMEAIVWMPSQHNPRSILLKDKEMKEVGGVLASPSSTTPSTLAF